MKLFSVYRTCPKKTLLRSGLCRKSSSQGIECVIELATDEQTAVFISGRVSGRRFNRVAPDKLT